MFNLLNIINYEGLFSHQMQMELMDFWRPHLLNVDKARHKCVKLEIVTCPLDMD